MKQLCLSLALWGGLLFLPAADAQQLYSNGPANAALPGSPGTGDAYTINFGYSVSDSLTLSAGGIVTGFDFTTWNYPGDDTIESVAWALGSASFGNDVAGGTATSAGGSGGTVSSAIVSSSNNYGYEIVDNTVTGLNVPLQADTTYYLTLSLASVASGDPVYWDENDGPSTALQSDAEGNIYVLGLPGGYAGCANGAEVCTGSETFDINGGGGGAPEPGTLVLLGCGLLAVAVAVRRNHRQPATNL